MSYIIFLNGPPGSGKDYAANVLMHDSGLHIEHYKFAMPLKRVIANILGVNVRWIEDNKNKVVQPFNVTVRQMLIDMSEVWFKPCYGKEIFGRLLTEDVLAAQQVADEESVGHPDAYVISDSGFDHEAEVLIREFGTDNCLLVRLIRDGYTFEGDSRSYIELPNVHTIDIHNRGEKFAFDVVEKIKWWMKQKEKNND